MPAIPLRTGTLAHWTASEPEGPWTLSAIPALLPGETGAWDAAGFSESRVNYVDGGTCPPGCLGTPGCVGSACNCDSVHRHHIYHRAGRLEIYVK